MTPAVEETGGDEPHGSPSPAGSAGASPSREARYDCLAFDADDDGDVDLTDYTVLRSGFTGPGAPVSLSVPEPGAPRAWEAGMGVGTATSVNSR
ncbi:MAG: hypothetical protein V2A79_07700, partial [Planctomycetota bacterium]